LYQYTVLKTNKPLNFIQIDWTMVGKDYTDRLDNGWKRLYRSIGQWVENIIQIDWTMGGKYYTDRLDNGWKRLYRSIGQWVEKIIKIDWTMGGKYYTDRLDNGWKRLRVTHAQCLLLYNLF